MLRTWGTEEARYLCLKDDALLHSTLGSWETEEARYLCLKDDSLLHSTLGRAETQADAVRYFNQRSKKRHVPSKVMLARKHPTCGH